MNKENIIDYPLHNSSSDYVYTFGSYFSLQFKIFAFGLSFAGIQLLTNHNLLGIILLIISSIFIFSKNKIIFSFTLERYKNVFSFFKLKIGKWQAFENFEYVSIFTAKKSQVVSAKSQSMNTIINEIEIGLVYNKNKKLIVKIAKNSEDAFLTAKHFAEKLNIKIYDATQNEPEWVIL